jgi:predicted transcriptional regulator
MTSEGFILENKNRKAVFQELASGETDPERIAKKHHLIERVVDQVLEDLAGEDLITGDDAEGYELTDEGESLARELKNQERL